ncbi:hypothetical protein D1007_48519 [Hordeum vulgare]|nr:hypothetical protein D1007_48519 [Hordeum vulgare]
MLCALHPRSNNPPELVSDLIDPTNKRWDINHLREHLQEIDVQRVVNIPLSSYKRIDEWALHYERSGSFSAKSAYKFLMETKRVRENWLYEVLGNSNIGGNMQHWKTLWNVKVPAKLHNFAWRLAKNSVPTEAVHHNRNMSELDVCPFCNAAEDTWKDALVQCPMAKSIWSLVDVELVEHMIACNHSDAKLWLFELQESIRHETFVKLIVTLWSIWWVRTKAVHEEQFRSPLTTFLFIQRYMLDLQFLKHETPVHKPMVNG